MSDHRHEDEAPKKEPSDRAARSVLPANMTLPPNEPCPHCNGPLEVEGIPPSGPYTAWMYKCPCGKTQGMLKGL